jgi:type II secretory pathway pseudopilin PulG
LRADDGFTLLETLMAAVVLIVGLTTLLGLLDTSLKASASTQKREVGTNLAREILEDARTIPYGQLSPGALVGELQVMHGLANASSGSTWQIVRHGTTYTINAVECVVDDPKDGLGKHENSFKENPYCAGEKEFKGEAGEVEDAQPEDLKRITVDITWTAQGRSPNVHSVTVLTAAGEAPGLTAGGLHLETPTVAKPTEPLIVEEPIPGTLTFAVTAPVAATAMRWALDGVTQAPAPVKKSGTTWNFSWSIPYPAVSDGTYQVTAQAIDATGVTGPPVSIPVTLIRGIPAAVKELRGGINDIYSAGVKTRVVELQWQASSERNVIGYRIYRLGGAKPQLVCPTLEATLSVATSCIDFSPALPSASSLKYSAFALYRDSKGTVQQGTEATLAVAGEPVTKPNVPVKLELTKNADGSVTLTWPESTGSPAVSFYRVYRGSTNYTARYEVAALPASGTTVSYTDTDAEGAHSYWVTAVTQNLTESVFVGPVSG